MFARLLKDYTDFQKYILIPAGSKFELEKDDRIYVSRRGLHVGSILIDGRSPVIPQEYYIIVDKED